jgi:hypothetical protein
VKAAMVASTAGPTWTRRTTVWGWARESMNPRGSRWPRRGGGGRGKEGRGYGLVCESEWLDGIYLERRSSQPSISNGRSEMIGPCKLICYFSSFK